MLEWLQRNEAFCIGCHNSVLHKFVRIETCDAQWLFKLPTTHCSKEYLTRNLALKEAPTVQQTPGVSVSKEEQRIANDNVLEYTFQIELRLKSSDTILGKFQELVIKSA